MNYFFLFIHLLNLDFFVICPYINAIRNKGSDFLCKLAENSPNSRDLNVHKFIHTTAIIAAINTDIMP